MINKQTKRSKKHVREDVDREDINVGDVIYGSMSYGHRAREVFGVVLSVPGEISSLSDNGLPKMFTLTFTVVTKDGSIKKDIWRSDVALVIKKKRERS